MKKLNQHNKLALDVETIQPFQLEAVNGGLVLTGVYIAQWVTRQLTGGGQQGGGQQGR